MEGTIYDTSSNRLMRSFRERYDPESLGGLPELVAAKLSATLKRKVSIGGGTISSAAYRDYAEGMHYLREAQDPGRARNSFDKALKDQGPPSVINLRVAEAEILDYPGTHSPASLARASLILDRPGPPVRSDAATALLVASLIAARDPAQAPAAYRDAVKTHPESGELWRNLAEALRIANRSPDEAASAYRQAIALEPGYFQPWLNFGVFSIYRGQYEEARDQFARASALAPGLALPHRDLANALLVLNEYSRAEQEYREALNIQRDPDTFVGIGALLAYQGRHADSVYYYEQAAALSPEDSLTLSNLADSYRRTGRTDEALRTYARVIATAGRRLAANPQSAVDRAFKAYALARSESLKPALSEIRSAVRGAPGNVMVRRMAATTFEALGMRREALDQIRAAPVLISELSRQPDLADLRRDPRFIEMSRADINFRKAEHTE